MIGARLIEALVFVLTAGSGLVAAWLLIDLLRLRTSQKTFAYAEPTLFVLAFLPAAFFMLRSAIEASSF